MTIVWDAVDEEVYTKLAVVGRGRLAGTVVASIISCFCCLYSTLNARNVTYFAASGQDNIKILWLSCHWMGR